MKEEKEQIENEEKKKNPEESIEKSDEEDSVEFLRYLQEVQKFPLEMESLQTSIESNRSTVRLANESITHFKGTRSDNRLTLLATLGVSILTLTILLVQTCSYNKTEIIKPIELKPEQVKQILNAQEKNSLILSSQIDSIQSEINKLNKKLNTVNKKR